MTTLNAGLYGNIVDIAKREDPDGKIAKIIELQAQHNSIFQDAPFRPTNDKDTHQSTRRTSLITPTRRRLNQGTTPSKSGTAQVIDRCTSVESQSRIDEKIKRREGENFDAYRLSEDLAHMEGFNQKIEYDFLYATTVSDPEDMSGFMQRYSDKTGPFGANVIDAGGSSTDNASILLVNWGEATCHGIYPKNSKAGLMHEDKGLINVTDANGATYWAYVSQFVQDYGLAMPDPRSVARIGSIDVSDLAADLTPTEGTSLFDYMTEALTVTHQGGMGMTKPVFYMNQTLHLRFYQQAYHKSNVDLTLEESVNGGGAAGEKAKKIPHFCGVPIKRVDQMLNTEAAI